MIVDTSVLVAILRREDDALLYVNAIEAAARKFMVCSAYLELCIVMVGNRPEQILSKVDETLSELDIKLLPFSNEMAEVAAGAFVVYGKGRHAKAALNFGDCMSYAASKVEAMPLLFKCNDFTHTDVERAI